MVLGQLTMSVTYRDKVTFIKLYKAFIVLPNLCYAAPAWSPYYKADKDVLENIQKRAIMMVTNLEGIYEEKCYSLRLPTLEERRVRGDLIETYKILTGKSSFSLDSWFTISEEIDWRACTRGMSGFLNIAPPPAP